MKTMTAPALMLAGLSACAPLDASWTVDSKAVPLEETWQGKFGMASEDSRVSARCTRRMHKFLVTVEDAWHDNLKFPKGSKIFCQEFHAGWMDYTSIQPSQPLEVNGHVIQGNIIGLGSRDPHNYSQGGMATVILTQPFEFNGTLYPAGSWLGVNTLGNAFYANRTDFTWDGIKYISGTIANGDVVVDGVLAQSTTLSFPTGEPFLVSKGSHITRHLDGNLFTVESPENWENNKQYDQRGFEKCDYPCRD